MNYEPIKKPEMPFCLLLALRTTVGAVAAAAAADAEADADADAAEKKDVIVCWAFFAARLTLTGSTGAAASTGWAAAALPAAAASRREPTSPASSMGHLTPTMRCPPSSSMRTTCGIAHAHAAACQPSDRLMRSKELEAAQRWFWQTETFDCSALRCW